MSDGAEGDVAGGEARRARRQAGGRVRAIGNVEIPQAENLPGRSGQRRALS